MTQAGSRPTCPNCGTQHTANDKFCAHCGFSLIHTGGMRTEARPHPTPPAYASTVFNQPANSPTTLNPGQRRVTGGLRGGELLEGRYRIVRLVGKGGFGAVYEANDQRFQARRTVAIKELGDSQLSFDEKKKALEDFHREADFLVMLKHPNLPNVSDFFEEAGKAYLVMEFIDGKTLRTMQEEANTPLDELRVMNWALQLCDVLTYLHTQPHPIIFRDLKPSNVMLTAKEQIKLIDFGIARIFKANSPQDTSLFGSRGYAPIEQYGQGQSDGRSDIYALGATLYDLLTGTIPPDAFTRHHNPSSLLKPRQLNPRISPATESIVLKAMADDPRNRFQSVSEMYQAIVASGVMPVQHMSSATRLPQPSLPGMGSYQSQVGFPAGLSPAVQTEQPRPLAGNRARLSLLSRRNLLIGGAAALVGIGATAYGISRVVSASMPTITVDFIYSTEKEEWLADAINAFNQSGKATYQNNNIQINPQSSGSLDLTNRILAGEVQPAAWSPASSLELDRLNTQWQQKHGQDIFVKTDTQPLVLSPLVFAVWQDRANVLLNKYGSIDWAHIYDALRLRDGWVDIGGQASWQHVSLGQTRPDESNSGLLTITLMANAYFNKTQGLTPADINNPGFLNYFSTFETAVTAFGHSSGTYLEKEVILKGPGAYDITFTYENLVLTAQDEIKQRQPQKLRMFYPRVNIESDHPFALLQAPWVKPEMHMAAQVFRDFLLDVPAQQLALKYGLRPTNAQVHIDDSSIQNNLFLSTDIRSDIQNTYTSVQLPGGQVVDELENQWLTRYKDAATGNG